MFQNIDRYGFLSKNYVWLWIALAFQAGFANAGGFLACARFVSHMTGFGTQMGMSISHGDYFLAFEMLCAPAAFMFGAMISAMLVDRPMIYNRPPQYLAVMTLIFLVFFAVPVGGLTGLFGYFGEPLRLSRDFELLSLLCFACGLQNACFASLTRGQIRTTHLTGITTDIGTSLVKLFYLDKNDRQSKFLKRFNAVRMAIFVSFFSGSAFSVVVFSHYKYNGFWFLTFSSFSLLSILVYKQKKFDRRKFQVERFIQSNESKVMSA